MPIQWGCKCALAAAQNHPLNTLVACKQNRDNCAGNRVIGAGLHVQYNCSTKLQLSGCKPNCRLAKPASRCCHCLNTTKPQRSQEHSAWRSQEQPDAVPVRCSHFGEPPLLLMLLKHELVISDKSGPWPCNSGLGHCFCTSTPCGSYGSYSSNSIPPCSCHLTHEPLTAAAAAVAAPHFAAAAICRGISRCKVIHQINAHNEVSPADHRKPCVKGHFNCCFSPKLGFAATPSSTSPQSC